MNVLVLRIQGLVGQTGTFMQMRSPQVGTQVRVDRVLNPPSLTKTKTQKARARANKRAPRIVGQGSYDFQKFINPMRQALKPVIQDALVKGGGALGSLSNVPGGAAMGAKMGRRISKLIGSGDYTTNEVSVNSLINPGRSALPSSSFGDDGTTIRFKRREFIGDVLTGGVAGVFTNNSYYINPGLPSTFPFLSQLAANYEEYCFDGLVFEFVTSASPYISTSALGTVIASMEYNASSPSFASKFTMENSSAAVSTRLDKSLMYGVECAVGSNVQNCYYVRDGTSVLPLTSTDLGIFQLAIAPGAGVPASSVVGELWVTYDVCLKRPVMNPSRVGAMTYAGTAASATAPAGTKTSLVTTGRLSGSSFATTVASSAVLVLNGLVGDVVQVTVYHVGTSQTFAAPTITYSVGCVARLGVLGDATASSLSAPGAIATVRTSTTFLVQLTATVANVTLTYGANAIPSASVVGVSAITLGNAEAESTF